MIEALLSLLVGLPATIPAGDVEQVGQNWYWQGQAAGDAWVAMEDPEFSGLYSRFAVSEFENINSDTRVFLLVSPIVARHEVSHK